MKKKMLKLKRVHYSKVKPITDRMVLYRTKGKWRLFFTKEDLKKLPFGEQYVTLIPKEAYTKPHKYYFSKKLKKVI